MSHQNILICDLANMFVRAFVVYPSMNSNGEQMGGVIGTLKTLKRLMDDYRPTGVYIVWESGGSPRRRSIFKEYKMNRKPGRINRWYEDDIPESETNRKQQQIVLMRLLKHLPVCQVYVPDCEGDDVIAYLAKYKFAGVNKTIVSSDKDMHQLLDETTKQYSLHKKTFVTAESVLQEYRITTSNFALAKSLCGDPGDNVPGIKGLGFKTAVKLFPMLGTEHDVTIQQILDYSASHVDESRLYKTVLASADDIRRNWKLVYLDNNTLSGTQIARVNAQVDALVPKWDKIGMIKTMFEVGLSDIDVDGLGYAAKCIDGITFGH